MRKRTVRKSRVGNHMMAFISILLLCFSCCSLGTHAQDDARPPNFIFMFADDLGFGDLKSYGHPYAVTDNVDRLAKEGTAFHGFHNTGNICPNSRTGFMTSRNPSWFPNYTPDFGFRGAVTVTQLLKDAGYVTGHIGKWNIGDPKPSQSKSGIEYPPYGMMDVRITGDGRNDPRGKERERYDLAIDFVEEYQDVPFYLNIWQYVPHSPILPPDFLTSKFDGLTVNRTLFGPYMQENFDTIIQLGGNIDTSMKNYLGEIYGMDIHIGRLLTRLDELGLTENTIVIFSSDNGPAVNDRADDYASGWSGGLRGGKHNWYEGGPAVPFLVRWPGRVPAGKVNTESFFSALDWLPTICSLAGASYPEALVEGEDVSDIWLGSDRSREKPTFYQDPGSSKIVARYGRWKLHQSPMELYDISADIEESTNVFDEFPDIVAAMTDLIEQYKVAIPANHAFENQSPLPFDPSEPVQEYVIPEVLRDVSPTLTPAPSSSTSSNPPSMYVSSSTSPSMHVSLSTSPSMHMSLSTSPSMHMSLSTSPSTAPTVPLNDLPSSAPSVSLSFVSSRNPTSTPTRDQPTAPVMESPTDPPSTDSPSSGLRSSFKTGSLVNQLFFSSFLMSFLWDLF